MCQSRVYEQTDRASCERDSATAGCVKQNTFKPGFKERLKVVLLDFADRLQRNCENV
jgi:hypothetical protein